MAGAHIYTRAAWAKEWQAERDACMDKEVCQQDQQKHCTRILNAYAIGCTCMSLPCACFLAHTPVCASITCSHLPRPHSSRSAHYTRAAAWLGPILYSFCKGLSRAAVRCAAKKAHIHTPHKRTAPSCIHIATHCVPKINVPH
jgi:hypothetical protein